MLVLTLLAAGFAVYRIPDPPFARTSHRRRLRKERSAQRLGRCRQCHDTACGAGGRLFGVSESRARIALRRGDCVAEFGVAIFQAVERVGGHPRDPIGRHLGTRAVLPGHPILAGLSARAQDAATASRARIASRLPVIWRSTRERMPSQGTSGSANQCQLFIDIEDEQRRRVDTVHFADAVKITNMTCGRPDG